MTNTPSFLGTLSWPAGVGGDVFWEARQQRSLGWSEGKPSLHNENVGEVLAVRVLEKGAEGILSTRQVPPDNFTSLVEEARALARVGPADPSRRLGTPSSRPSASLEIDPHLFEKPADHIQNLFHDLERQVLAVDPRLKKIIKFQFSETRLESALRNSFGVATQASYSSTSFMAEILAEENGETEVAWDSASMRFGKDLNVAPIALELAQHALSSLGGRSLPTGEYAVVLAPRVGVQILELLSEALSADAIQMGRSFLAGKKGSSLGSSVLTVLDDPLRADGVASALVDDEGTPRSVLPMLNEGVLTNYFYDLRTAQRDATPSNGRGHRSSAGTAPKPSATNFFVKPGSHAPDDLLAAAPTVFLVRDVMGLHMADRITGEFSLGASGVLYKQGVPAHAVRGVTMAGSVSDLLKRVQSVGSDFRWYGSVGCPSLFIKSLSIAGA